RLLDLANAYAALGAQGRLAEPFAVQRVRDRSGAVLYARPAPATRQVLSAEHAYLLSDILSDADARILGFGEVTPFELPFPAAAKSGTSTGARDTWTLGYTPEVAIGVWVGNANGEPLYDVAGIEGAGPIWRAAMVAAAVGRRMSWYARPPGVIEATVCAPTGLLPGPDCPSPVRELFARGTVPTSGERYYSRDADGRVVIDPPLEARTWAHDAGLPLRGERRAGDTPRGVDGRLRIVSPVSGSVFFIAAELARQQLVLRAAADPGGDEVARLAPVTVTFESAPKERAAEKVLELSPATKGTYTWLSERTVLFQPDFPGLLRGMTYTVTVPQNAAAGITRAVTKTFTVAGRLAVQQVIPGDGDTEVPLGAQILVQFNRSVAPLTTLAAQRTDPVIAFDPPLAGKGEWLNT